MNVNAFTYILQSIKRKNKLNKQTLNNFQGFNKSTLKF